MIFAFSNITVEISDIALKTLLKHEQSSVKNEEGGILLGKYIPEKEYYLISEVTEPTKEDTSERLSFIRSFKAAQKIIDKRWKESKGIVNYLGEWHTHPWEYPSPSCTDKNLMKSLVKDGSNVWKHLILIIVGLNNTLYLGICDLEHNGKIILERTIGGIDASVFD